MEKRADVGNARVGGGGGGGGTGGVSGSSGGAAEENTFKEKIKTMFGFSRHSDSVKATAADQIERLEKRSAPDVHLSLDLLKGAKSVESPFQIACRTYQYDHRSRLHIVVEDKESL